jgi:hypothetical protein
MLHLFLPSHIVFTSARTWDWELMYDVAQVLLATIETGHIPCVSAASSALWMCMTVLGIVQDIVSSSQEFMIFSSLSKWMEKSSMLSAVHDCTCFLSRQFWLHVCVIPTHIHAVIPTHTWKVEVILILHHHNFIYTFQKTFVKTILFPVLPAQSANTPSFDHGVSHICSALGSNIWIVLAAALY